MYVGVHINTHPECIAICIHTCILYLCIAQNEYHDDIKYNDDVNANSGVRNVGVLLHEYFASKFQG